MRKLISKPLKRILKQEHKKVYCLDSRKEMTATYYTFFGFFVCVKYEEIEEPVLGI